MGQLNPQSDSYAPQIDPDALRQITQDPGLLAQILGAALPNITYRGVGEASPRVTLKPGQVIGSIGQLYSGARDQSQREKLLVEMAGYAKAGAEKANQPEGARLSPPGGSQTDEAARAAIGAEAPISTSILEQARALQKPLPTPADFMQTLTPDKRRLFLAGMTPQGQSPMLGFYGQMTGGEQQARGQQAEGLLRETMVRYTKNPEDQDAQHTLLTLLKPESAMQFGSAQVARRAQIGVLVGFNVDPQTATKYVDAGMAGEVMKDQYAKAESVKKAMGYVASVQHLMSPTELKSLTQLANLGIIPEWVHDKEKAAMFAEASVRNPELGQAYRTVAGMNPLPATLITRMMSNPETAPYVKDLLALSATSAFHQQSLANDNARLGLMKQNQERDDFFRQLNMYYTKLGALTGQRDKAIEAAHQQFLQSDDGMGSNSKKVWEAKRAGLEQEWSGKISRVQEALNQIEIEDGIKNYPTKLLYMDKADYAGKLATIEASKAPAEVRLKALLSFQQGLEGAKSRYLLRVPGGAELYAELKQRADQMRLGLVQQGIRDLRAPAGRPGPLNRWTPPPRGDEVGAEPLAGNP